MSLHFTPNLKCFYELWTMACLLPHTKDNVFATNSRYILFFVIEKPEDWLNFTTELKKLVRIKNILSSSSIFQILRKVNFKVDRLACLGRSYVRPFCFIDCDHMYIAYNITSNLSNKITVCPKKKIKENSFINTCNMIYDQLTHK